VRGREGHPALLRAGAGVHRARRRRLPLQPGVGDARPSRGPQRLHSRRPLRQLRRRRRFPRCAVVFPRARACDARTCF
jgi:hypothetical protein